ncbi:MAG TPA: GFA family protein [Methylibium sp.]|nr:GFA family protein [Methylibium sp.]
MTRSGQCYCGAIRFECRGEPDRVSLCHCRDCRMASGAPVTAWAAYAENALAVTQGAPKTVNRSGAVLRSFCGDCGTGLFYRNAEVLPGLVDVQSSLFDDAATLAPREQVQAAERLPWMASAHTLPAFDRYPGA